MSKIREIGWRRTSAIEAINLTKVYKLRGKNKEVRALDGLNLFIKKGEIFGLVGPNGAGKTTFIDILTTIRSITSGEAYIDGFNVHTETAKAKSRISLMLGAGMNYTGLTGYSNLKYYAKIYRINNYKQKINELAKSFGLENWLDQYVLRYSTGMVVKLAICRTLLLDRPILLLDEPARGLDVKTKDFMIKVFKESNKTILVTSHNMDLVEELCDHIAFIQNGKIIKVGKKEEILKSLKESEVQIETTIGKNIKQLFIELKDLDYVRNVEKNSKGLKINIINRDYYNDLISVLTKYRIQHINEIELSITDVFKQTF